LVNSTATSSTTRHQALVFDKANASHKWVVDNDPFSVNQFGHLYQGTIYYGFASYEPELLGSAGVYARGQCAVEIAGGHPTVKKRPDRHWDRRDLPGEPLFRISNLLLERADGTHTGWRGRLGAALISPHGLQPARVWRRFDTVFGRDAAYYSPAASRKLLGASPIKVLPATSTVWATAPAMSYRLPGQRVTMRPFDYFDFEVTAATSTSSRHL
jgi:hypothetical protein